MSRILVWRADGSEGVVRTRRREIININEDAQEPTVIGKPRGPETPICRYCGKDARLFCQLHPFRYIDNANVIHSGLRCA